MKSVLALLLSLIILPSAQAQVQESCVDLFITDPAEARVQRSLETNNLEIFRGLIDYYYALQAYDTPTIIEAFRRLSDGDVYLDARAGAAGTAIQVVAQREKLRIPELDVLAVGYKKPDYPPLESSLEALRDHLKYIDGGRIEDLINNPASLLHYYKNQVDLLTGVMDPLAYGKSLEKTLNTYADLLKVHGQAFIAFDEVSTTFTVRHKLSEPQQVSLRYLSRLIPLATGGRLRVLGARQNRSENDFGKPGDTVLWLQKVSDRNLAPRRNIFILSGYEEGLPPVRHFEVQWPQDIPFLSVHEFLRREAIDEAPRGFKPQRSHPLFTE